MKQKMQVRERIVGKIQHTSVDLMDYGWIRMVQACSRAVSDLFRTCLGRVQTRFKSLCGFGILPALQLSGFYSFATGSDIQTIGPEKHAAARNSAFKSQAKCSHCGLERSATVRKIAVKIHAKRCLCGPESVRKYLQRLESSQPLLGKEGKGKTEVLIVSDLFQTCFRPQRSGQN